MQGLGPFFPAVTSTRPPASPAAPASATKGGREKLRCTLGTQSCLPWSSDPPTESHFKLQSGKGLKYSGAVPGGPEEGSSQPTQQSPLDPSLEPVEGSMTLC